MGRVFVHAYSLVAWLRGVWTLRISSDTGVLIAIRLYGPFVLVRLGGPDIVVCVGRSRIFVCLGRPVVAVCLNGPAIVVRLETLAVARHGYRSVRGCDFHCRSDSRVLWVALGFLDE